MSRCRSEPWPPAPSLIDVGAEGARSASRTGVGVGVGGAGWPIDDEGLEDEELEDEEMDISRKLAVSLLDAAPNATLIVDTRGTIVFASARVADVFGYEPSELIHESVEILLPARLRQSHTQHRGSFFEHPKPRPMGAGLELCGLRKDGREVAVEISLSPVETPAGLLVLAAILDITDRKAIERELVETRNEAVRANRAKSAFLAAASHDLRQPLQTLTLLNTALARIAEPNSRMGEIATRESQALSSMSELLHSLLDISKLEAGAVKPDIEDCCVKSIFERLRAQFSAQAEAKGLAFLVDECDEVVHTDPTLLEQIVQNLVANAIRYTQAGFVELRCRHHKNYVEIAVLDTGIGIAPEERALIFEEFYQAPRAGARHRDGLGLGLSIVRRVAELLELPLELESTPGKGSCFALSVPLADGAERPATPASSPRPTNRAKHEALVLVIDDDTAVASSTALLLEIEGYRVVIADHFDSARARLAQIDKPPDLIVCDYHLGPGPDGVETVRMIREVASRPVPAVLVTGDTSYAAHDLASTLEGCRVLSKPVDGDALLEALLDLLE